jgi:hypothetical protein
LPFVGSSARFRRFQALYRQLDYRPDTLIFRLRGPDVFRRRGY